MLIFCCRKKRPFLSQPLTTFSHFNYENDWNFHLFDCWSDYRMCAWSTFCTLCLHCEVLNDAKVLEFEKFQIFRFKREFFFWKINIFLIWKELAFTCCIPNDLANVRTKIRSVYRIKVSLSGFRFSIFCLCIILWINFFLFKKGNMDIDAIVAYW
jgi:Cys-rich protein (TIGR01571 family)